MDNFRLLNMNGVRFHLLSGFLKKSLIKVLFQNFFYFWALKIVVGVDACPFFSKALTQSCMSGF